MKNTLKATGFTIIEVIVAITIVAILTAIIMPNLSSSRAKARDGTRISDVSQLQGAMALYYDRCGEYPSSLAVSANNGCPSGVTLQTYISQIPTAPGGVSYGYATQTSGTVVVNYVLHTTLEYANAAVVKGLSAMPSGTWSATYTCSNADTSKDYCVTSN